MTSCPRLSIQTNHDHPKTWQIAYLIYLYSYKVIYIKGTTTVVFIYILLAFLYKKTKFLPNFIHAPYP